ncbi:MAG: hypothetical protein HY246_03535 [Proteobacteria bacterium]|nr:hypothetical protein [Pseudomonadota bacterium]
MAILEVIRAGTGHRVRMKLDIAADETGPRRGGVAMPCATVGVGEAILGSV